MVAWNPNNETPAQRLQRLNHLAADGSASANELLEIITLSNALGVPLTPQQQDPAYIKQLEQAAAQAPVVQADPRGRILSSKDYFTSGAYAADTQWFNKVSGKRTGYDNLDDVQNFYPGLYVIGAITSLGKTTFIHQMADQLASQGTYVLYFSLEQSRAELMAKSLARKSYQMAGEPTFPNGPQSIGNILQIVTAQNALRFRRSYPEPSNPPTGKEMKPMVDRIIDAYIKDVDDRLYIIQGQFGLTVEHIIYYVEDFIKQTGIVPVVVVDYLQIIRPSEHNGRLLDGRAAVDHAVSSLKQLQLKYDLILILISSLNRQNYMLPVDQESFKESGGIEYTVDVLWGLQLAVLHSEEFTGKKGQKAPTVAQQREMILKARTETPRKIELVNLKNRFNQPGYTCYYDYYAAYDAFCEDGYSKP